MGELLGREIELDTTTVAHGGIFIARHDGRVVFASDTLPGERIIARVTEDSNKSFLRADTVRVLEASPHRQAHIWTAASIDRAPEERAGGAEFGHIALPEQRALKAQVLREGLARFAGIQRDVDVQAVPGDSSDGTGWRTRVTLHVDEEGRVGPFAARSHHVIEVDDLPLATNDVQAAAPLDGVFDGAETVSVVAPSDGGVRVFVDGATSKLTITERVGSRSFRLAEGGFWQVHRHAATVLTEAVQRAIDAATFDPSAANLDLYGGVGLLAAAVGDRFGDDTVITSVESDAAASAFAADNLLDWPGASVAAAPVERYLRSLTGGTARDRDRHRAATIVLDPPRSGAGKSIVATISGLQPAQIVYVACDPIALSRDLGLFAAQGYTLDGLEAFDLFPNTHHVEAVASLRRG
jgi:tRNA/tmRNA/rRNA uracil-C5-methylase (TrmA/RlmC/RlmD family)